MKFLILTITFALAAVAQADSSRELNVVCRAPLYEGELQIFAEKNSGEFVVSDSGIEDYPTTKMSAGPGGLFLKYLERGVDYNLEIEPYAGPNRDVKGEISLSSNPSKVLQTFNCSYNL